MPNRVDALEKATGEILGYLDSNIPRSLPTAARDKEFAPNVQMDGNVSLALQIVANDPDVVLAVADIVRCVCDVYMASKKLDALTRQYCAAADKSIAHLKQVAPSVIAQVKSMADQIQQLLQPILKTDLSECSPEMLKYRSEALGLVSRLNEQSFALLMKLMSI